MISLSYPIAVLYNEPRLQALIAVSSLQFPISGLSVVHTALLSRSIRFRDLNTVEVVSTLLSGLIAIVCALSGLGVWSLLTGALSYPLFRAFTSYLFTRWKPIFTFDKQAMKDLFRYSVPLIGSDTLNYWVRNADNFLLGKYWGAQELGFYSRAYALMTLPIGQITYSIGAVMFPFLSR
jgi:PST family polysaccharide transporter